MAMEIRPIPVVTGNDDLDDYFGNDATLYQERLLGKTYWYLLDEDPSVIVCAFTLSNDSVRVDHLPGSRKKESELIHSISQTSALLSSSADWPPGR